MVLDIILDEHLPQILSVYSACIKGSLGARNCPGTSKNQCQEVWDSQVLKISDHL